MLSRMTKINSYKDLRVWQQGMDVVDLCFDIIDVLPTKYCFIFCNQLLRAAISIPANISEGTRRPRKAYLNHLSIALGSEGELETLLEIIRRRKLAPPKLLADAIASTESAGRMLHALVRSLEQ